MKLGKYDERIPKLVGVLCLFLGIYCFIAFTSYLFTWKIDQDSVLRFSWGLLLQGDVEMANWLGRLGAIVSNMFFYWGFGIPSFLFVGLFFIIGLGRIRREPFRKHIGLIWNTFWVLLFFSVLLEFLFPNAEFPWGGAFGEVVSTWLVNFVGVAGMIALLIFILVALVTWFFNPNYREMNSKSLQSDAKYFYENLISGRIFRKKKRPVQSSPPVEGLRPGQYRQSIDRTDDVPATAVSDTTEENPAPSPARANGTKGRAISFRIRKKRETQKARITKDGRC